MAKAVYLGSAASYVIGSHTFRADGAEVEVDDHIAKVLKGNPEFEVDGERHASDAVNGEEAANGPVIPSGGFNNREEALAFAAKWLPKLALDPNRSTAELTRQIDAGLLGIEAEPEATVGDLTAAEGEDGKPAPKPKPKTTSSKKVAV